MRGIDEAPVTAWLLANVDGVSAPFTFSLIAGGRSNLTFMVSDACGRRLVLRRPPLSHVLATAHDMAREHRLITAVGRTDVPVPATYGLCTDETVNGAPFYVMDHVEGVVLDSRERGGQVPLEQRRPLSEHLVDVLADLHAVDPDEVGLGDLARRSGYVERQVKRWSGQWESSKMRELPAVDEAGRLLRELLPAQHDATIAHGDYRFGNCLVDPRRGRVVAVLDWELCTLGDPLADVGYLGVYWSDPGEDQRRPTDPSGLDGFPRYDELLERYARRTGRDLSAIDYYVAFSSWRLAVINEGVYARYAKGAMGESTTDLSALSAGTVQLAERALDALRRYR